MRSIVKFNGVNLVNYNTYISINITQKFLCHKFITYIFNTKNIYHLKCLSVIFPFRSTGFQMTAEKEKTRSIFGMIFFLRLVEIII